jgi:hypothetical protein
VSVSGSPSLSIDNCSDAPAKGQKRCSNGQETRAAIPRARISTTLPAVARHHGPFSSAIAENSMTSKRTSRSRPPPNSVRRRHRRTDQARTSVLAYGQVTYASLTIPENENRNRTQRNTRQRRYGHRSVADCPLADAVTLFNTYAVLHLDHGWLGHWVRRTRHFTGFVHAWPHLSVGGQ